MMLTIAIETEITGIAVLYSNLPWTKEDDERLRAFVAQGRRSFALPPHDDRGPSSRP
jgi:hypothetical protein